MAAQQASLGGIDVGQHGVATATTGCNYASSVSNTAPGELSRGHRFLARGHRALLRLHASLALAHSLQQHRTDGRQHLGIKLFGQVPCVNGPGRDHFLQPLGVLLFSAFVQVLNDLQEGVQLLIGQLVQLRGDARHKLLNIRRCLRGGVLQTLLYRVIRLFQRQLGHVLGSGLALHWKGHDALVFSGHEGSFERRESGSIVACSACFGPAFSQPSSWYRQNKQG